MSIIHICKLYFLLIINFLYSNMSVVRFDFVVYLYYYCYISPEILIIPPDRNNIYHIIYKKCVFVYYLLYYCM